MHRNRLEHFQDQSARVKPQNMWLLIHIYAKNHRRLRWGSSKNMARIILLPRVNRNIIIFFVFHLLLSIWRIFSRKLALNLYCLTFSRLRNIKTLTFVTRQSFVWTCLFNGYIDTNNTGNQCWFPVGSPKSIFIVAECWDGKALNLFHARGTLDQPPGLHRT